MKKLFLALIALVAMTANAQNGVSNPYRFGQGEDSVRCIQSISIMNTNVKNKDYKVAYESWKVLFDEFPVARVDTYTNGIKIINEFIKKEADPQKKEEYIDLLMAIYDQQIKYLDLLQEITKTRLSEGQILGKKVIDLLKHRKNAPVEEVYEMLSKSVALEQGQSEYVVTELFMKYSGLKYKNDQSHGEQIIEDYLNASVYIVDVLDKYHDKIEECEQKYQAEGDPKDSINAGKYSKMIDASRVAKSNIDAYFINSGAASCEDLDRIYAPLIEENKNNIEYLNKVITVMAMLKCTKQDAYFAASEYAFEIDPNPTSKAAMGCGYRYFKRGDIDKAMEYFDRAIELEPSVTNKSELCYKIADIYYQLSKYGKARSYAQKALALNSKYGEPHILIARCYAATPTWSDDNTLNNCTYYLCIDRLERAKSVDPSVKREADKYIATYKKYTPSNEELFMKGYKNGEKVTIGGWINETTTIR
ncbi:MAG: tetratricopeptide repeat protein [Bacteroidaceae bacterium]|nr:tetratricopeptide repeat protein [Bacteroidaceae bacterium]